MCLWSSDKERSCACPALCKGRAPFGAADQLGREGHQRPCVFGAEGRLECKSHAPLERRVDWNAKAIRLWSQPDGLQPTISKSMRLWRKGSCKQGGKERAEAQMPVGAKRIGANSKMLSMDRRCISRKKVSFISVCDFETRSRLTREQARRNRTVGLAPKAHSLGNFSP